MSTVIAHAALVPVLARRTLRAEQVTQLVLGETAAVVEEVGEWRHVAIGNDRYEGWVHTGYLREVGEAETETWQRQAVGWSDGAVIRLNGLDVGSKSALRRVPLRARLAFVPEIGPEWVRFPDGREGMVVDGKIDDVRQAITTARAMPIELWVLEHFAGAPYLWGGVTPWGVDCSGLVQTAFAARGVALPRDSIQQAEWGAPVPLQAPEAGDLLFFRSEMGPEISHVAFAGPDDTLIHATVACGGVVIEPRLAGARAQALHQRLVAVRRIEQRS